eukprot:6192884-Pleurochrysis_carterae.AAC.1
MTAPPHACCLVVQAAATLKQAQKKAEQIKSAQKPIIIPFLTSCGSVCAYWSVCVSKVFTLKCAFGR